MRRIFITAWIFWLIALTFGGGCGDFHFEALRSGQSQTDTDTDTRNSGDGTDTDELLFDQILQGEPECLPVVPQLNQSVELPIFTVGNGTAESCDDTQLRAAIGKVNQAGAGKVQFACGSGFTHILLTAPLRVGEKVQLHMDGDRRVALDGRQVFQIFVLGEGSISIFERVMFVGGKATGKMGGAAIMAKNKLSSGSLTISECVFKGNISEQSEGGAVLAYQVQSLWITRSVFLHNSAATGGALYFWGESAQISNSVFSNNRVDYDGGAMVVQLDPRKDSTRENVLCGSRFSNNSCDQDASAVKVKQSPSTRFVVELTEFESNAAARIENQAAGAGALWVRRGHLTVRNSTFVSNVSTRSVAGIFAVTDLGMNVVNCTFYENVTEKGEVGAILQRDANPSIIRNSTFGKNFGVSAGAVFREEASGLTLLNNIFEDDMATGGAAMACNKTFLGQNNFQWANVEYHEELWVPCAPSGWRTDPYLHAPQYNDGGFVKTCRIEKQSPVKGSVRNDCPLRDARGVPRLSDCCDAGAYELWDNTLSDAENGLKCASN